MGNSKGVEDMLTGFELLGGRQVSAQCVVAGYADIASLLVVSIGCCAIRLFLMLRDVLLHALLMSRCSCGQGL